MILLSGENAKRYALLEKMREIVKESVFGDRIAVPQTMAERMYPIHRALLEIEEKEKN